MFYFGSPEESATLYYSELESREDWPKIPRKAIDEMSGEEAAVALTYLNTAWREAYRTGASQAILDVIQDDYDKAFESMCINNRAFRKFTATASFVCPGQDQVAAKRKYRQIALSHMSR